MIDAGVSEPAKPAFCSPSSQEIRRYFENRGLLSRDPQDLLHWKGALGGWTDDDGVHGHIFFIAGRLTENGIITAIRTVEGNADFTPDNAVASEVRRTPVTREGHRLWFLNCSFEPGGQWW